MKTGQMRTLSIIAALLLLWFTGADTCASPQG